MEWLQESKKLVNPTKQYKKLCYNGSIHNGSKHILFFIMLLFYTILIYLIEKIVSVLSDFSRKLATQIITLDFLNF